MAPGPLLEGNAMAERQPKKMSPVGKRIWLHMQAHEPPYDRTYLARKLTEAGTFPTTPQSISNYLHREHPPPEFINAVAREFKLTPEEESELHQLYFHGGTEGEETHT